MNSITDILPKVVSKAQQKFLSILFSTIIFMRGKVNFTNLSRYSEITERTYRRQFSSSYNFMKGNAQIIEKAVKPTARQIIATDCSFVPKSGKATYGREHFYNGCARRAEKGLEISVIAIVDVDSKQGYTLSVQQTPPTHPESERTRIDGYLEQLEATKPYLPKSVNHVVSDGFYSKIKWVDGVMAMGLDAIGKLRCDADMHYVYTGVQKPRGRKRKLLTQYVSGDISNEDVEVQLVFDVERDHYQWLNIGWQELNRVYRCVMHFDIKDGKIWLQQNLTDQNPAEELIAMGVSRQDIVLGLQPPYKRPYTDYGVA